ncbi:HAD-IA family hydrolase [Salinisphaera sp. SPP-AMP-43]|uniref:HAD family hydrolase n=1 Tax=Salinisphaera sp. SPP-AMP-43 TaxID=3121288 RepID=UPI003C6DE949
MTTYHDWLVFDLGGVLVEVAAQQTTLDAFATLSATPPERLAPLLRERFGARPWSAAERLQVGELDFSSFHAELNQHLVRPLEPATLVAAMESMLQGVKRDTEAVLAQLAGCVNLACYSNTNAIHWRYMQTHYGFFGYFQRRFASQELGRAKPDLAGYEQVCDGLSVEPSRCVLIDDRQANVAGARQAGWQAIHFESAQQLAADLKARGIAAGVSP